MAQWKRAGPITQRSVDRNYALLLIFDYVHCQYIDNEFKDCCYIYNLCIGQLSRFVFILVGGLFELRVQISVFMLLAIKNKNKKFKNTYAGLRNTHYAILL